MDSYHLIKLLHSASRLCAFAFLSSVVSQALPAQEHRFVERSEELGFSFVHDHFTSGERYMVETFGSGLVVFDANGDDLLDIYCMQGAPKHGEPGSKPRPISPKPR